MSLETILTYIFILAGIFFVARWKMKQDESKDKAKEQKASEELEKLRLQKEILLLKQGGK